jgi:hypothetical protein
MASDNQYSRDELSDDLAAMVAAGILNINMREDGEWLYSVPAHIQEMPADEREAFLAHVLENLDDYK